MDHFGYFSGGDNIVPTTSELLLVYLDDLGLWKNSWFSHSSRRDRKKLCQGMPTLTLHFSSFLMEKVNSRNTHQDQRMFHITHNSFSLGANPKKLFIVEKNYPYFHLASSFSICQSLFLSLLTCLLWHQTNHKNFWGKGKKQRIGYLGAWLAMEIFKPFWGFFTTDPMNPR